MLRAPESPRSLYRVLAYQFSDNFRIHGATWQEAHESSSLLLTSRLVTLPDAAAGGYASIVGHGVGCHVAARTVGLPADDRAALNDDIRANGHQTTSESSPIPMSALASDRAAAVRCAPTS